MPPCCASAMARWDSVTVSIAELTMGTFKGIARVSLVRVSASAGSTSLRAGKRSTSSKVSPSGIESWIIGVIQCNVPGILVEHPKHPCDEDDDQDRTDAYTGAAPGAPTAMPVVSAAATQQQNQNDNQYQHHAALFRFRARIAAGGALELVTLVDHLVTCFACDFLRFLGELLTRVAGLFGDAVNRIFQMTGNIVDSVLYIVLVETHDGAPHEYPSTLCAVVEFAVPLVILSPAHSVAWALLPAGST